MRVRKDFFSKNNYKSQMSTQYTLAIFSHLLSKFTSPRDRVTLFYVLYLKKIHILHLHLTNTSPSCFLIRQKKCNQKDKHCMRVPLSTPTFSARWLTTEYYRWRVICKQRQHLHYIRDVSSNFPMISQYQKKNKQKLRKWSSVNKEWALWTLKISSFQNEENK